MQCQSRRQQCGVQRLVAEGTECIWELSVLRFQLQTLHAVAVKAKCELLLTMDVWVLCLGSDCSNRGCCSALLSPRKIRMNQKKLMAI